MKKILVTGGAGFIGSHIVDRLIEEECKVVVLDNLSKGRLENLNNEADFERIDISNNQFTNLIKKIKPDIVFHLAAQSSIDRSIKNPKRDIEVNLLATQDLLDAVIGTKISKVIFASSAAVYAKSARVPVTEESPKEPISLYGVSK